MSEDLPPPEDVPPEPVERRYPSTIGGAFYLAVLGVTGLGLGVVVLGDWRVGVRVVAGALVGAASLRLVLRDRDAGMLKVRHRLFDVTLLAGLAAALWVLASTIPNQPGA